MTSEQQSVKEWMQQFQQETPEKPVIPNLETRKLRAKLILEEALETLQGLGISAYVSNQDNEYESIHDFHFDFHEVDTWKPSLELIADGCEDLKVVTEGTLVACGLVVNGEKGILKPWNEAKIDPLFNEVMRSNFSKLWTKKDIELMIENLKEQGATLLAYDTENPSEHKNIPIDKELLSFIRGDIKHVVKDKDGKVIKSPSYSPANLGPIIDKMSK